MDAQRTEGPVECRMTHARSTWSICALLSVAAMALVASIAARADNSYSVMLQNTAMWQANLTKQMINLGGRPTTGSGGPAPCMPPYELQRGVDGHVPPELQGDPRYQAYLRCSQGSAGARDTRAAPQGASIAPTSHLPITATDFVRARPGRPVVDQAIAAMQLAPEQRTQLRNGVEQLFTRVATQYRDNNLAVSVAVAYSAATLTLNGTDMNAQQTREFVFNVNDMLARHPRFASMTPLEKQNESDRLIFQGFVIAVLRDLGMRDARARQQATEFAREVMKQFNGA